MAIFNNMVITTKGEALYNKVQAGISLNFTKMKIGSGQLAEGDNPEIFTGLKNYKFDVSISSVTPNTQLQVAVINGTINNTNITEGQYICELGLFAEDPDEGEILYGYASAGTQGDYIAPNNKGAFAWNYQVNAAVGNATEVTATVSSTTFDYAVASSSTTFAIIHGTNQKEINESIDTTFGLIQNTVNFEPGSYTATQDNTTSFIIDVPYNPSTDHVEFFYLGNQRMEPNDNYTLTGTRVDLVDWSLKSGEKITYNVWKFVNNVPIMADGSNLQDNSVASRSLTEDVQENINQVPILASQMAEKAANTDETRTTTNKTVTGAINELNANKAEKTDVNNALTSKTDKTTTDNIQSQVLSLASGAPKAVSLISQMTDITKNYVYTGSESGYISGNWYYWNGNAWVAGGIYQSTGIADGSITPKNTNFITIKTGKNLFDKTDITVGKYISITTGNLVTGAGFNSSNYIYVLPNTNYYVNYGGRKAFYDINKNFISSLSGVQAFTTPSGTVYLRQDFTDAQLSTAQIEKGNYATNYESFHYEYFLNGDVYPQNAEIKTNIVTVSRDGTSDYDTVFKALSNITDANKNNLYEIHVKAGNYTESITTKDYVDIIGESLDNTFINFNGDIETDINSQGAIYATSTSKIRNIHIKNKDGKYPIHSDSYVGDYSLLIENCILENLGSTNDPNWNGCPFGIGLYAGQHITIKDCELIGYNPALASGIPGILCHNNAVDHGYRSLRVENCKMKNVAYGVKIETLEGTTDQHNDFHYTGNIVAAKVADILYVDPTGLNCWNVYAYGNNIRRVANNTTYIVEEPGFTRRVHALVDISKSDVVTFHIGSQYGYVGKVNTENSMLVEGIALEDIPSGEEGIIQIAGFCPAVKVNGTNPISNGDTLVTYSESGIAAKGTVNPFAIATQAYNVADSNGIISAWLISKL